MPWPKPARKRHCKYRTDLDEPEIKSRQAVEIRFGFDVEPMNVSLVLEAISDFVKRVDDEVVQRRGLGDLVKNAAELWQKDRNEANIR